MKEDTGEFWRRDCEDSLLDDIEGAGRQKQTPGTCVGGHIGSKTEFCYNTCYIIGF